MGHSLHDGVHQLVGAQTPVQGTQHVQLGAAECVRVHGLDGACDEGEAGHAVAVAVQLAGNPKAGCCQALLLSTGGAGEQVAGLDVHPVQQVLQQAQPTLSTAVTSMAVVSKMVLAQVLPPGQIVV